MNSSTSPYRFLISIARQAITIAPLKLRKTAAMVALVGALTVGFLCLAANAQTGEWSWMGGSSTVNQSGVYGTLGQPASGNIPGSRWYASQWTDSKGNLWLFGGDGYDASGSENTLNDLWEFNPSTDEWTWMGGDNIVPCGPTGCSGYFGVYGTLGTPDAGNAPGGRYGATSWTDNEGNLWLFGGTGYDANGNNGWLNDLWEYTPATNEWAWMSGSNTNAASCQIGGTDFCAPPGQYGSLGTPAEGNAPAGRMGAVGWKDSSGNMWLFGGETMVEDGVDTRLNDLWMLNPSTNEWTWMGGSIPSCTAGVACDGSPSVYGTQGVPGAGNFPGARWFASSWTDSNGDFWLFGGEAILANDCGNLVNDLWEFNPSTNEWTWMGGGSTCYPAGGQSGVYGTQGTPAAGNVPGSRKYASSWTDPGGNLWLMGGLGYDVNGSLGYLNDLWGYSPVSNGWTWMAGSNTANQIGVPGGLGSSVGGHSPEIGNKLSSSTKPSLEIDTSSADGPGARASAAGWIDSKGNLWLFGGSNSPNDFLNDLWEYQLPAAAAPSFTFAASPSSFTASSGGQVTTTLTVTPQNGFSSSVSFACSGLPTGASCSFNPSTVTPSGIAATTKLTITAQTADCEPASRLPATVPGDGPGAFAVHLRLEKAAWLPACAADGDNCGRLGSALGLRRRRHWWRRQRWGDAGDLDGHRDGHVRLNPAIHHDLTHG